MNPEQRHALERRLSEVYRREYGGQRVELRSERKGRLVVGLIDKDGYAYPEGSSSGEFEVHLSKHAGGREIFEKVAAGIDRYYREKNRSLYYESSPSSSGTFGIPGRETTG